ncbi:GNAT family N-acetyltransferase [Vibrio sonorensis]|uniref:GNAT family N-acetyltransferase n=1 Tax=Vibrio sonorensis TaxID=1004316 RepID=UPI0008DADB55|nr:GNAT family N-acetyltransferase [Vibrio sonorensis]
MDISLRILTKADAKALLDFETVNRYWFEHQIGGRGEGFYSLGGVQEHIALFMLEHKIKKMFPFLIFCSEGSILGRVNITNIDSVTNSAEVGYRVGESHTGKGVAKTALKKAIEEMSKQGLSKLIAFASTANLASQAVLTKNGFKPMDTIYKYAVVDGKDIDCIRFEYEFK